MIRPIAERLYFVMRRTYRKVAAKNFPLQLLSRKFHIPYLKRKMKQIEMYCKERRFAFSRIKNLLTHMSISPSGTHFDREHKYC